MKKFIFSIVVLSTFVAIGFQSCIKDTCDNNTTYTRWVPIYKTDAEMQAPPQYQAARPMKNTGKIYFYGKYILINERKEGIHVIDNSNPANPLPVGFLNIVGNVDMAVKGNFLYADSYRDLLTIDISTISNPRVTCRAQDVFQSLFWRDPQRGWLVDYKQESVNETIDCNDPRFQGNFQYEYLTFADGSIATKNSGNISASAFTNQNGSTASAPAGVGGSMARFTFYDKYLYCIDNSMLRTFNLTNLDCPSLSNSQQVGWNIETVFPYKDKLFIGSTTGMFIYDLVNPTIPVFMSRFDHGRACDPVVVENDVAYITVRSGNNCGGTLNQLQIVNVSNLKSPQLIRTFNMENPRGLSVWDNTLYLCDAGLKIFDATDKDRVDQNLKTQIKGFDTFDVIPYAYNNNKKYLMVIGADGLYQFDVTDNTKPIQLSKILVNKG
ncbi:MAG: hypothetical protein JNL70_12640 [Saprospiraceae bacterium]|nr:hypothetical protein [Saprospiraceae bacterium]